MGKFAIKIRTEGILFNDVACRTGNGVCVPAHVLLAPVLDMKVGLACMLTSKGW